MKKEGGCFQPKEEREAQSSGSISLNLQQDDSFEQRQVLHHHWLKQVFFQTDRIGTEKKKLIGGTIDDVLSQEGWNNDGNEKQACRSQQWGMDGLFSFQVPVSWIKSFLCLLLNFSRC